MLQTLILQILEKSHGDSGEFDATSSNENDSDDEDGKENSPGDEAQDSPGIKMTPANFDPDVRYFPLCGKIRKYRVFNQD